MKIKIENIKLCEITEACNIIKVVFDEFAAEEYSTDGAAHFYQMISVQSIRKRFLNDSPVYVAKIDNRIAGYMEISSLNHIYLLFVKKEFHKKGVAGNLVDFYLDFLVTDNPDIRELTVNSTLSAVSFYEKLGFKKIADYQFKDSILSYPMRLIISEYKMIK